MKGSLFTTRFVSLGLIFILVWTTVSCSAQPSDSDSYENLKDIGQTENTDSSDASAEDTITPPELPDVNMEGYEFLIATRDDNWHEYDVHTRDLYAEADTGGLINYEVYKRNMAIEERFNCRIRMEAFPERPDETLPNQAVEASVMAGDAQYDLLMTHVMYGVRTVMRGVLLNINALEYVNLDREYWNQNAVRNLSVGENLFIGLSDLSFSTMENVNAIFFNKQFAEDYKIENLYDLVNNNEWTFDKFAEITAIGAEDLNGDGKMDENDRFGYVNSAPINFLWAGGSHLVGKDENNYPYMDFMNERTVSIFEKVYDFTTRESTYSVPLNEWHSEETLKVFRDGNGLIYSSMLSRINDLRGVEWDFGVLPYPKYDSSQDMYYSYVDAHAQSMAVPLLLKNETYTGIIIEALSFYSYRDVLPVYYDVVLTTKLIRDEESAEMMKVIKDGMVYDFGYAHLDWGGIIRPMLLPQQNIASVFAKKEKLLTRSLENIIESYDAIDKNI